MAKLPRKTCVTFGLSGSVTNFGQFGSKEAGTPQTSQDPTVIQGLSAWVDGWTSAVVAGDKAAYIEDMNGFCLVAQYMSAYIYQMGIPEWDSATTYFIGSVVQGAAGGPSATQWFVSLQNNNLNNAPPASSNNAFWTWVNPPTAGNGGMSANVIPKSNPSNPAQLINSHVSDDGTDVIITLPLKFPDNTIQSTAAAPATLAGASVVIGGGSTTQTTLDNSHVIAATLSITLSGTHDVLLIVNGNAITAASATRYAWGFLVDGSPGPGQSSGTGVVSANNFGPTAANISATKYIAAGVIPAGSHTFQLVFFGQGGDTITWPGNALQGEMRFTVKEIL